ncbi:acyltransferase family protein [Sphingomonas hylomeconis]|uniref:Acyltransferase family protein n=1 Tax=Sphingomonas hylomeconis TaxID=1395958 RepID=A0ABV7SSZ8_9SPHN|nr:acyltransferase [Sphingomonas hylomeconis]
MQKDRHYIALDAWRGVCALLVVIGHLKTSGYISAMPISGASYRFVDFFFVLSGFVITHSARDGICSTRANVWSFIIRRIGRLWPLHIAVLLGFIAYELVMLAATHAGMSLGKEPFSGKDQLAYIPANILLIQAWNTLPSASWNIPAWSISAEFAAYLIFAACFGLCGKRGMIPLVAIGIISAGVIISAGAAGPAGTFDYGVPRCLFGFAGGALIYSLWRKMPDELPGATAWEAAMVLLTFAVVIYCPLEWGAAVVPVFCATVLVFAFEKGAISRVLMTAPGQFLGKRSYSIYMVHVLIVVCILSAVAVMPKFGLDALAIGKVGDNTGIVAAPLLADALIVLYVAVVLLISTVTFDLIEEKWRKRSSAFARRFTRGGTQQSPVAV